MAACAALMKSDSAALPKRGLAMPVSKGLNNVALGINVAFQKGDTVLTTDSLLHLGPALMNGVVGVVAMVHII